MYMIVYWNKNQFSMKMEDTVNIAHLETKTVKFQFLSD